MKYRMCWSATKALFHAVLCRICEQMQQIERWRLGVVSYLNAKPLIQGLERDPSLDLRFEVPSRLAGLLDDRLVDCALVPVIDLAQPNRPWQIISDSCIGCDGETFTVRVFSKVPAPEITRLHVDGDSHTSIALSRVLWKETYGTNLEIIPFDRTEPMHDVQAVLLIGDKVINHNLVDFEIETDLGSAWKSLTGLPFVFAAWAAPKELDASLLAAKLSRARDVGVQSADLIAADFGPGMGWPVTLAKRYLTARLKFKLGPREKTAMTRFFQLARQFEIVPTPHQDLIFA